MASGQRNAILMSSSKDSYLQELFTASLPKPGETPFSFWDSPGRDQLASRLAILRAYVSTVLIGLSDDLEEDQRYLSELVEIMGNNRNAIKLVALTGVSNPEVPDVALPADLIVSYQGLAVEKVRELLSISQ